MSPAVAALPRPDMTLPRSADSSASAPVVLTGATGFLGAHLLAALLADERRVIVLGRSRAGEPLAVRLHRLLGWFGLDACASRLEAVEVDFLRPHCGLPPADFARLAMRAGDIIHCASDTSFTESRRAQVFAANVDGLRGLFELAAARQNGWFHLVSSAYAAGLRPGLIPEALLVDGKFVNSYEASKAAAEHLTAEYCRAQGIPFTVLRPAIVYGDFRTGRSLKFNALYKLVQALRQVRDVVGTAFRKGSSRKWAAGVGFDAAGLLHVPMRVPLPQEGLINLVPVDYFVAATRAIIAAPTSGGIYHLASDDPPPLDTLAGYCWRFLGLAGIEIVYGEAGAPGRRQPLERLLAGLTEPYRPYLADRRRFATDHARQATGGLTPPEFDYAIFERCMRYAESVGWGERLFARAGTAMGHREIPVGD